MISVRPAWSSPAMCGCQMTSGTRVLSMLTWSCELCSGLSGSYVSSGSSGAKPRMKAFKSWCFRIARRSAVSSSVNFGSCSSRRDSTFFNASCSSSSSSESSPVPCGEARVSLETHQACSSPKTHDLLVDCPVCVILPEPVVLLGSLPFPAGLLVGSEARNRLHAVLRRERFPVRQLLFELLAFLDLLENVLQASEYVSIR